MDAKFLNQVDLARRWKISPRSLERQRWLGDGPPFVKIGGAVRYLLSDVESYEQDRRRARTPNSGRRRSANDIGS